MLLHRHSATPLYRQLSARLEQEIRSGSLAVDDRLPFESELAETYGLNRLTVRAALASLSQRGLIRTVRGVGSFVAAAPIRHEISGAREASLTRAMRERGHVVTQHLLSSSHDEDSRARAALGTRGRIRRYDLLRHVDEVPWTLTWTWVAERRFAKLEQVWTGTTSLYEALEQHYGVEMRRAYRSIHAEAAGPAECEHLMVPIGAPLLVLEGLNVDTAGRPVAFVEHRGRGDRARLAIDFD